MTNKKIVLIILLLFLVFFIVQAITLTRDKTEKVIVPFAIQGEVCLIGSDGKCLQDNEPIIVGRAEVYPVGSEIVHSITLMIFKDKLYRSTTANYEYYQTNCKEEEHPEKICQKVVGEICTKWKIESGEIVTVFPEGQRAACISVVTQEGAECEVWGTAVSKRTVCDITGLKQQSGALSLVTENGVEIQDNSFYLILYGEKDQRVIQHEDGTKEYYSNNIEDLEIKFNQEKYTLQKISRHLAEEIIWIPK